MIGDFFNRFNEYNETLINEVTKNAQESHRKMIEHYRKIGFDFTNTDGLDTNDENYN